MRIALISDTHFPRRGTTLPAACLAACHAADLVIHAGDLADRAAFRMLEQLGPPVVAVQGNVDDAWVRGALPETAEVEASGVVVGVVHDAGPEEGRVERLRRRFPRCGLVVFGHSHIPFHGTGAGGFQVVNPGSPTDRRRQPLHSMAVVTIEGGEADVAFLSVDHPPGPLPDTLVRRTFTPR